MVHSDFVHLHNHTEYSLLDGACRVLDSRGKPGPLIHKAVEYRMPALAITDHGNMFGAIEFYNACMESGVKPIIGCEVYVAPLSRLDKQIHRQEEAGERGVGQANNHMTLLARDYTGYRNLMKLVSIGFVEGFYYRPRIDRETLSKYAAGLVALSGCMKGEIPRLVLGDNMDRAKEAVSFYKGIFGAGNFYLELMDNGIQEQKKICERLIEIGRETATPLVATNDCHYLKKKDAHAQEIVMCIGTGKTIDDPSRLRFSTEEFYFKSGEEMKQVFKDVPSAIRNTIEITEKCILQLDFGKVLLPHYDVPEGYELEGYLEKLCDEGLKRRFKKTTPEILARLKHELGIIKSTGFAGYFLIVWDFIDYAKKNNIPVGPGRGSGAGSLVSYLLGITELNPLQYGLLFERFLNPERKSMPDLDIDFADTGRDRVIEYVKKKYGENNVAQIITFGTLLARAVIRDTGRVLNISLADVDRVAKLIPFGETIQGALQVSPELKKLYDSDKMVKDLLDTAQGVEGLKRHSSVHAAGIVIAPDDMTNYTPFAVTNKGVTTTQYEGESLTKLGLLKMDFLGLRTLTVIENTLSLIEKKYGVRLEPETIPLGDGKTYRMLGEAKAIGIFQLESAGMRDLLKKIKPTEFFDLIAVVALFRPGPIGSGMVDDFIERKHGKRKLSFEHPLLEPILKNTYGVILYQEQVMRIAVDLAGFSGAQADVLRYAMGKKVSGEIEKQREDFNKGTRKKGISLQVSNRIFDRMAKFGGYGFNKSHASAYALLSYQTAYLKANYALEFMTTLLNSEIEDTDKIREYIDECAAMGIRIKPPDIRVSFAGFVMEGKDVRFGLGAIKNVGTGAIESIVQVREEGGSFKSLLDFASRVNLSRVDRRMIESLIKAGAFDSMGQGRARLFAGLDGVLEKAGRRQKDMAVGQTSFLDMMDVSSPLEVSLPDVKEWTDTQLLSNEKEVLGFYISGHPLARYGQEMKNYAPMTIQHVNTSHPRGNATVGGIVLHLKRKKTMKGQLMAVFKLEDLTGMIEVIIFPESYKKMAEFVGEDEIVIVKGNLDYRENQPKVIANEIIPFSEAREKLIKVLTLKLSVSGLEDEILKKLSELFKTHVGACDVKFDLKTLHHGNIEVKSNLQVKLSDELLRQVEELVGHDAIHLSR